MSLVPFTAPTAAGKGAVPMPRQAITSAHTPATPSVSRGHDAARAESAPSTRRNAAKFAHVLAAAQQQDDISAATAGESRAALRQAPADRPEPGSPTDDSDAPAAAVAPPAEPQGAAPPQTPWLLLALGAGGQARADESAGTCDTAAAAHGMAPEFAVGQSATNLDVLQASAGVVAPVLPAEARFSRGRQQPERAFCRPRLRRQAVRPSGSGRTRRPRRP